MRLLWPTLLVFACIRALLVTHSIGQDLASELTLAPLVRLVGRYQAVEQALSIDDRVGAQQAAEGSAADAIAVPMNALGWIAAVVLIARLAPRRNASGLEG